MKDVVVIGTSGQLAQCLKAIRPDYQYIGRNELDLVNAEKIAAYFKFQKPKFIINLAAYTQVDKAEGEKSIALTINADANQVLARNCERFICISTDYVFAGDQKEPYKEKDFADPINHYGFTKLMGERLALETNKNSYILRTSWLYSEFGVNFVTKMLALAKDKDTLKIVDDQIGTPTNAHDLAQVIVKLIETEPPLPYGIYHYSNLGVCSWYEFAKKIFEYKKININLIPISSQEFPTAAARPKMSVLDKTKIQTVFDIAIPSWEESLMKCLKQIH